MSGLVLNKIPRIKTALKPQTMLQIQFQALIS